MLIWEAHRALANSIGDTCNITITNVPDGVRFSKSLRDSYLYRAMLKVYNEAMTFVSGMPHAQASMILERLFPNMCTWQTHYLIGEGTPELGGGHPQYRNSAVIEAVQFILSARTKNRSDLTVPIPVKSGIEARALTNDRNIQKADSFVEIFYNPVNSYHEFLIWSPKFELQGDFAEFKILPYPRHPDTLAPGDRLDMEDGFGNKVISIATVFALIDSQDIENTDRYLVPELGLGMPQGGR